MVGGHGSLSSRNIGLLFNLTLCWDAGGLWLHKIFGWPGGPLIYSFLIRGATWGSFVALGIQLHLLSLRVTYKLYTLFRDLDDTEPIYVGVRLVDCSGFA